MVNNIKECQESKAVHVSVIYPHTLLAYGFRLNIYLRKAYPY